MVIQKKAISTVIVLATLVTLAAGMVWEGRLLFSGPRTASPVSTDGADEGGNAVPAIAGPPIKVGVILSYRTGVEVGWTGSPYGFDVQASVLNELRDPKIQIVPIIEPGTATKGPMRGQLRRYFHAAVPVDGGNVAALEKLDVIVASATWRTTDSLIAAVHEAVSNGVGLLNGAGMGVEGPEYGPDHPAVAELAGLIEGQYGWNPGVVACKVLQPDPLLGTLAKGAIVHMAPNGAYGIFPKYAKPLIGLTNPNQARGAGRTLSDDPAYVFYPLYLSSLGRGRIVGVQFAPYMAVPAELQHATGSRFYIRCVEWLAGRPVQ